MDYPVDILNQRARAFVLWIPGRSAGLAPPNLVLGRYDTTSPDGFHQLVHQPLAHSSDKQDLWELPLSSLKPQLQDGVYHYWFEIEDTSPEKWGKMLVTDPFSFTVDYRILKQKGDQRQPASVIKLSNGELQPTSPEGIESPRVCIPPQASLPSNNHLVIYELPTSWTKSTTSDQGVETEAGTFTDVKALFDRKCPGSRFSTLAAVRDGAILSDLGINALELLPAADAKPTREWGYATANYFAPDADLGSSADLASLVEMLHSGNTRLFADVVMAFGHDSYGYIDFPKFHLRADAERSNPDAYQSHADGQLREGWGGQLWRYMAETKETYNPESGSGGSTVQPAWEFHKAHLARWMVDFGLGGLRLDSVNNIGSWDFVRAYKERAWWLFQSRYPGGGADPSKFLVIGEELSMPVDMVHSGCLNALWNERFQERVRCVLLGEAFHHDHGDGGGGGAPSFEESVRRVVDCTLDATVSPRFTDGAQAVNYLTSHDVEGYRKERLFNYLQRSGVWDIGRRTKLAFALLLTSVGVPMIFAGEEFADRMDRSGDDIRHKQTDPVNYARKDDGGWREELFGYVSRLVRLRTGCPALGVDDTEFFHVDRSRGGKIMAWRRGGAAGQGSPVVVVANFTDEDTPGSEYFVPNWPERERAGWREVAQERDVPMEWVGREPLMAWEAKVYTYWRG